MTGVILSLAALTLVKATPTFYLLDARMLIVAKPIDAEELGKKLKELLP